MLWTQWCQVYYNLKIWKFLEITVLSLKVIIEMKQIKRIYGKDDEIIFKFAYVYK